jgi:hypothetical protein
MDNLSADINTILARVTRKQYDVQTEVEQIISGEVLSTESLIEKISDLNKEISVAISKLQLIKLPAVKQKIEELETMKLPTNLNFLQIRELAQFNPNLQMQAVPVAITQVKEDEPTQANYTVLPFETVKNIPRQKILPLIFVIILLLVTLFTHTVQPCGGPVAKQLSREDKQKEFKKLVLDTQTNVDQKTINSIFA